MALPVAICGLGEGCMDFPKDWEVWSLAWGEPAAYASMLFDPHDFVYWPTYGQNVEDLNDMDVPVLLPERHPKVPKSVAYPYEQVQEIVGEPPQSSIAYMIGFALLRKRNFGLFGVHMRDSDEYGFQRANCRYLLGLARGMGVKYVLPDGCGLADERPIYGKRSAYYDERWLEAG